MMSHRVRMQARPYFEGDPIEAHPLFRRMDEGSLSVEASRAIALDVFHVVDAFPRFLAALLAQLPDHRLRMELVENLYQEHGAMDPAAIHVVTYRAFLHALGVDDETIDASSPGIPAIVYVRAILDLAGRAPYVEALAALGVIEEIVARVSPIVGRFGARIAATDHGSHFSVHETLDFSHADELYAVAERAAFACRPDEIARGLALGWYYQRRLYDDLVATYVDDARRASEGPPNPVSSHEATSKGPCEALRRPSPVHEGRPEAL